MFRLSQAPSLRDERFLKLVNNAALEKVVVMATGLCVANVVLDLTKQHHVVTV